MDKKGLWKAAPGFLTYLVSQGVSLLGSTVVSLAIIWYVTLQTDSGVMIAGVAVTTYLPQLLTLLLGGQLAERFPSKRIVMLSDGSIAVSTLVLAFLFIFDKANVGWILFFNTLRALGTGIQLPAYRSILPKLVPEEYLMRANSLSTGVWSLIQLIAPPVGGLLMKSCSMQYVLFLDIITAVIGIGMLATVKVKEIIHTGVAPERNDDKQADKKDNISTSFREGIQYLKRTPILIKCIIFYFIFQFLVMPVSMLIPMLVTRTLGEDVWLLSMVETAFSIGTLLLSGIMAVKEFKTPHFRLIGISSVLFGATMLLLLKADSSFWFLVFMLIMGFGSPLYYTPLMTHIQENVDEAHMGRMFALVDIASTIAISLGMLLFGPIANEALGISFIIPGIMLIILGIAAFAGKKKQ